MGELNFTKPINAKVGDKYGSRGGTHFGIDYPSPKGTSVIASEDGLVVRAADNPKTPQRPRAYGNVIVIYHNPGDPEPGKEKIKYLYTLYAHLDKMYVTAGDYVEKYETIGAVGSTGTSTGPHLHFALFDEKRGLGWKRKKGATGVSGSRAKDPNGYIGKILNAEGTLPDMVERAIMDRIDFVPDMDLKRKDPFRLQAWLDGKNIGYVNKYKDTLKANIKYDLKEELQKIWRKPLRVPKNEPVKLEYEIKIR
jgi:murein DD-endopeptidase MepM/ murein hydrolase activator NlpD